MCGILGFINHEHIVDVHRTDWIRQALLVDQLRGIDSTGLAVLPPVVGKKKLGAMRVYKKAMAAADFLQMNSTRNLLMDASISQFVLGHNRWATVGDGTNDNFAHPFTCQDVTLVHNGTLVSRQGLNHDHVVDSAAIAIEMGTIEPSEYIKVLEDLDGAFTLVWYNATNGHVYMTRNKERPMYMARGFKNKTLFFASEDWMIQDLLARIDNTILDITKSSMYDLWKMETDILYDFDLSTDEISWKETKYKPYEYVSHTTSYDMYGTAQGGYGHNHDIPFNFGGKDKPKVTLTDKGCPVSKGAFLYAEEFTYTPLAGGTNKGTLSGRSVDFDDVRFVVPNVPKAKYDELRKEFKKCLKWVEDMEVKEAFPTSEALFSGKITCITKSSKGGGWIVNLQLKSTTIDLIENILPEVIPGKKPLPALPAPDPIHSTSLKSQEKKSPTTSSRMPPVMAAIVAVLLLTFWIT